MLKWAWLASGGLKLVRRPQRTKMSGLFNSSPVSTVHMWTTVLVASKKSNAKKPVLNNHHWNIRNWRARGNSVITICSGLRGDNLLSSFANHFRCFYGDHLRRCMNFISLLCFYYLRSLISWRVRFPSCPKSTGQIAEPVTQNSQIKVTSNILLSILHFPIEAQTRTDIFFYGLDFRPKLIVRKQWGVYIRRKKNH